MLRTQCVRKKAVTAAQCAMYLLLTQSLSLIFETGEHVRVCLLGIMYTYWFLIFEMQYTQCAQAPECADTNQQVG